MKRNLIENYQNTQNQIPKPIEAEKELKKQEIVSKTYLCHLN